ncbi:MAG: prepilin peptidase [Clostridium sp.]|nr:prepilin peptidase [Clostridium sp.]
MIDLMTKCAAGLLLCRAVYTDVRSQKIENRLIACGLVCGIVLAAIRDGPKGVWHSISMVGIVFAALIILFVIKGLGAGDIKLFCMLAAFFPSDILKIVIVSFFAGGGIAIVKILWRFIRKQALHVRHETMNFSVPVMIGTGLVIGGICP